MTMNRLRPINKIYINMGHPYSDILMERCIRCTKDVNLVVMNDVENESSIIMYIVNRVRM